MGIGRPNMAIPFICWRALCSATVLPALLTEPPIGYGSAKPRDELARTAPTAPGIKPRSRTFIFVPCIQAFANDCRGYALNLNPCQSMMTTSTPSSILPAEPSRQVRRGQARKATRSHPTPPEQNQRLTDAIMDAASAKAAAAGQAASLAKAQLAESEIQAWLKDMHARLEVIFAHPEQHLGHIEEDLAQAVKEPLRLLAQRAAQVKANTTPCQCHECQGQLTQQKFLCRTIHSRFGPLTVWRRYGWCPRCGEWHFPADYALGLGRKAPASPYLQEISALLVSKMPAEQAVLVAERPGVGFLPLRAASGIPPPRPQGPSVARRVP